MIEGVIYKYTAPNGKCYIGQTTNGKIRREQWNTANYPYAGVKINRARKKYGIHNFRYEVLERNTYTSKKVATEELNRLEIYYIGLYNSYKNGYNCTIGGEATSGYYCDETRKEKIRKAAKGRKCSQQTREKLSKSLKGRKFTEEHRDKISKSLKGRKVPWTVKMVNSEEYRNNLKKVIQLTLDGKFIKEYSSAIEAAKENNFNSSAIYRCLIGLSKSSFGYKWIYKEKYYDNV